MITKNTTIAELRILAAQGKSDIPALIRSVQQSMAAEGIIVSYEVIEEEARKLGIK